MRGYRTRMRIFEKMKWVWVTGQTMVLRWRRRVRIRGRRIPTRQSNYEQHFLLPYVFLLHMWLSPIYVVIVRASRELYIYMYTLLLVESSF